MFSEYKGIPREARFLLYLSIIPNIAIGFIYTDLNYFLPNVQGLSAALYGLVGTTMGIALFAFSIPLGIAADRFGRRKMLILGNLCASLSLVGFALATNFYLYLVIAVLEGTGEAAYAVSVSALLADKAGDSKRTAAFSLQAFIGWIAGAVGSFVISSVVPLESIGFDFRSAHIALYVIVGLLNLSITPLILRVKVSAPTQKRQGILPRKSGKVILKFMTYSILIALGAGLFVPLMLLWFSQAYGVSDVVSGPVMGFTNLLTAGVVFMSPRLAGRFGLVKATVMTQAASTVFMLFIPSAPNYPIAASIYLVRVFLMNLSNPLTQSLIMGLVSPDERGMASGITASLWRLPNSLSQSVGAVWISEGLLAMPFYVATVLYVIGIALYWVLFKGAKLPEELGGGQEPAQSSKLDAGADSR